MQEPGSPSQCARSAPFPRHFRAKHARSKSGCLTCRKRRKKCNEEHPICASCRRNELVCSWPEDESASSQIHCPASSTPLNAISPGPGGPLSTIAMSFNTSDVRDTLALTQQSQLLFDHYMCLTSTLIGTSLNNRNAFGTHLVDLALNDSLLLHTVLAVSGAHRNFRDEASPEIRQAASIHYGAALHRVREEVYFVQHLSEASCFRLALILLLVCHVEAITASPTGNIYPHLHAVRRLIKLTKERFPTEQQNTDTTTKGLVMEMYSFMALISNITPYGLIPARTIPLDDFITDLEYLHRYDTYGTLLACGHDVVQLIAPIAVLAKECIGEDHMTALVTPTSSRIYKGLKKQLETIDCTTVPGLPAAKSSLVARGIFRNALLIFLETAISGPVVNQPETRKMIQECIDTMIAPRHETQANGIGTILLWPLMILASCCTRKEQQDVILDWLDNPQKYRMNHLTAAAQILRLLWASTDVRAFGPYGLYLVMQQHGIIFSMA